MQKNIDGYNVLLAGWLKMLVGANDTAMMFFSGC